jgi:hypothetical protein
MTMNIVGLWSVGTSHSRVIMLARVVTLLICLPMELGWFLLIEVAEVCFETVSLELVTLLK